MFFDPLYLLFILPGFALSLFASFLVKSTFRKYSQVAPRSRLSGAEVARMLIERSGLSGVGLEETHGFLSDHYDPRDRTLRLSSDVYHGRSLAALGVAAHEAGHAIQHATNYSLLNFRTLVVKPAMIGSNLGSILIVVGVGLSAASTLGSFFVWAGVILFSAFVLFTLVTVPVEIDASRRALVALEQIGAIASDEVAPTWSVLRAAALTYVASAITAIATLLYFLVRSGLIGGRSSDD